MDGRKKALNVEKQTHVQVCFDKICLHDITLYEESIVVQNYGDSNETFDSKFSLIATSNFTQGNNRYVV